jgi:phosphoribosyltransferase
MDFLNMVSNLFFPQTCAICDKICDEIICNKCKIKLEYTIYPNRKCFLNRSGIYYDEHMHICKYSGIIKDIIRKYKFKDHAYLYKFFAQIIYKNKKVMEYIQKYDYIIPVPLHKYRYRERGYNQAYLILKELSKLEKNIIIENNIIKKIENIKPQSTLNKAERKNNIKGVYEIISEENVIKNKKILIFDDVFTTGSTTNECSRILKEKNAKKVGILTIAKD